MGLAEVFEHLLGTGMSRVINFGDYVSALCHNLPELCNQDRIQLVCAVEPIRVSLDVATSLGIIITELVNNAYLHAFPNDIGEISVGLKVNDGRMLLSVSDNGVGFIEAETRRRGTPCAAGQRDLTLRSDHGSAWTIELANSLLATAA